MKKNVKKCNGIPMGYEINLAFKSITKINKHIIITIISNYL